MTRCQNGGIPLHPRELRAFDRAVSKQTREIGLCEAKEIADRRGAIFVTWQKRGMRVRGVLIPRTNFLADVASECVSFQSTNDVGRQRPAMLDRRVADAIL